MLRNWGHWGPFDLLNSQAFPTSRLLVTQKFIKCLLFKSPFVGILLLSPEDLLTDTDVIAKACENGGGLRGRERQGHLGDVPMCRRWKLFSN